MCQFFGLLLSAGKLAGFFTDGDLPAVNAENAVICALNMHDMRRAGVV